MREDYTYQDEDLPNVDYPVLMMDNDFRDPDVDRYLEKFEEYDPSVAVLGDAFTESEAERYNEIACEILDEYPYKTLVVVPKCREAFDELSEDVVLGYPNGYSDLKPEDYSCISDWRGRDVHILGGSPTSQWEEVEKLVQPNLRNDPPANIVGLDWNGNQKIAYKGEYWSRSGWKRADQLSIRETVRKGLEEIKLFWEEKGVWPETEPRDLYGSAVIEPDELIFMDRGGDPMGERENLEAAYVDEYEEYGVMAFSTESQKKHWEYYEGLEKV